MEYLQLDKERIMDLVTSTACVKTMRYSPHFIKFTEKRKKFEFSLSNRTKAVIISGRIMFLLDKFELAKGAGLFYASFVWEKLHEALNMKFFKRVFMN